MKSISPAGSSSNRTCVDFMWIYQALCCRLKKLRFCMLPFVVVCVFFLCWNLLISSDDWITVFERASLESEESWIETDSIGDYTVPACSLRNTVNKDNNLAKHFKFTVPVFQWRGSFTQSTLEKLQNSTLPYGWKQEDHDVIGKTLSLLWHSSTSRLFERNTSHACVRCAVVGNGGILRGSGQGKVIDSHDYVFRVNGAIIKGFENDVGTKTSFYGFTINSLKNSLSAYQEDGFTKVPRYPGIRYIFIPSQTRDYVMVAAAIQGVPVPSGIDEGDRTHFKEKLFAVPIHLHWFCDRTIEVNGCRCPEISSYLSDYPTSPSEYFGDNAELRMLHPYFIQYVTKRFLNSPQMEMYRDVYMPSTGALILLTALHTCDQVSAYGFITDNYEDFSDHYYDKVHKELVHYSNHDLMMESSLWKLLHTHKVMRLYQRQIKKGRRRVR